MQSSNQTESPLPPRWPCFSPEATHKRFAHRAGLEKSRLFKQFRAMDTRRVASDGYRGMMAGKSILAIPGPHAWRDAESIVLCPDKRFLRASLFRDTPWAPAFLSDRRAASNPSLSRLQLFRQLIHGRNIVELGQIGVSGEGFTLLAFHQNLHLKNSRNVRRKSADQRHNREFFCQHT